MSRVTIGLVIAVAVLAIILGFTFFGGTPKKVDGPAVKAAKAIVATAEDEREAGDIINAGIAQQVPCGAVAKFAFDPHTGNPRVWVYQRPDGIIECYNSEGWHRTARVHLKSITTLEVDQILADTDTYPPTRKPAAAPAPTPTPAPAATPAPVVVVVPTPAPCAHKPGVRILSEGGSCSDH